MESDSSYSIGNAVLSNAMRKLFYIELNCSLINLLTFIQMAMKLQQSDAIKTLSCFSLPNLLFSNSKDVKLQKEQKQGQKLGLHANLHLVLALLYSTLHYTTLLYTTLYSTLHYTILLYTTLLCFALLFAWGTSVD